MFHQTETKPQCWRALAILNDRSEHLLYLGRSSAQVRAGFAEAFFQVLDEEEREQVTSIALQRWHGAPDAGQWLHQTNLNIPTLAKAARSA